MGPHQLLVPLQLEVDRQVEVEGGASGVLRVLNHNCQQHTVAGPCDGEVRDHGHAKRRLHHLDIAGIRTLLAVKGIGERLEVRTKCGFVVPLLAVPWDSQHAFDTKGITAAISDAVKANGGVMEPQAGCDEH